MGGGNQLTSIDLTLNTSIEKVRVEENQLTYIDIRNGNNEIIVNFDVRGNPNLECINVDDIVYANSQICPEQPWLDGWCKDETAQYSENCPPIGIEESLLNRSVQIYPNPAIGVINIKSQIQNHNPHITITDILGREIQHSKLSTHHTEIDISNYSKGIYFLTIQQGNKTLTKKIIKL